MLEVGQGGGGGGGGRGWCTPCPSSASAPSTPRDMHSQTNARCKQATNKHKTMQGTVNYLPYFHQDFRTEILKPWVPVKKLIPPAISSLSDLALEWKQRQPSSYTRLSPPLTSKFLTAKEVVLKVFKARVDNILFLILYIMYKKWFMSAHACFFVHMHKRAHAYVSNYVQFGLHDDENMPKHAYVYVINIHKVLVQRWILAVLDMMITKFGIMIYWVTANL